MAGTSKMIFPKEVERGDIIVERTERGKATRYPVSDSANNACSAPNCTHVVVNGGSVWCYDNTAKIEVLV